LRPAVPGAVPSVVRVADGFPDREYLRSKPCNRPGAPGMKKFLHHFPLLW
jgi:hypothetical protein